MTTNLRDAKRYRVPDDAPDVLFDLAGLVVELAFVHGELAGWKYHGRSLWGVQGGALSALLWAGKLEEVEEVKKWVEVDEISMNIQLKKDKVGTSELFEARESCLRYLNASPEAQELAAFWLKPRELPERGDTYWIVDHSKGLYTTEDYEWENASIDLALWRAFGTTDESEAQRMANALNKLYGRE